jgi:hypothetical protein
VDGDPQRIIIQSISHGYCICFFLTCVCMQNPDFFIDLLKLMWPIVEKKGIELIDNSLYRMVDMAIMGTVFSF